jgi:hypothetical protein
VGDHVIDTNVLLVASAVLGKHFKDCDVPVSQKQEVLDWLMDFRNDDQRKVVLDQFFKIWEEYNHKMTGQDIGLLIVTEKLQSALVRFVEVTYDENGHGCLPPALEKVVHDVSDRKFVAAAIMDLSDGGQSTIVNAVDSDWCDWEEALTLHGIAVTHLIDALYQDWQQCKRKQKSKRKR